jgi:hypothetical protein
MARWGGEGWWSGALFGYKVNAGSNFVGGGRENRGEKGDTVKGREAIV